MLVPDRVRRALLSAGLLLFSLVCALILLEGGVRLWYAVRPPPRFCRTMYSDLSKVRLLVPHPDYPDARGPAVTVARTLYRYKAHAVFRSGYPDDPRGYFGPGASVSYVMNAQGFRGRDYPLERRPGVNRVALLGDSFTLGEGVHLEEIFSERLGRMLERERPPAEVLNFGISGYGSKEELALLRGAVLPFRPDLVVLGYVLNDIAHAELDDLMGEMYGWRDSSAWFRTPSRAVGLAAERLWRRSLSRRTVALLRGLYADPARWNEQKAALGAIRDLTRGAGGRLLVVVFPDIRALRSRTYPFAGIHRQLREFLTESGIPWIDLTDSFRSYGPEKLEVHPVDHHPNEIAHRIVAEEIRRAILERRLLPAGREEDPRPE